MDIREAILAAADHIERNPDDFDFDSVSVPTRCGSPGCAIGWVAHFARCDWGDVAELMGLRRGDDTLLYTRLSILAGATWYQHAAVCAKGLRAYADKYHPAPVAERYDWQALAQRLGREPLCGPEARAEVSPPVGREATEQVHEVAGQQSGNSGAKPKEATV